MDQDHTQEQAEEEIQVQKQSVSKPKKRNVADASGLSETSVGERPKRGKYTSVACLKNELSQLRQQVSDLVDIMKELKEQTQSQIRHPHNLSPASSASHNLQVNLNSDSPTRTRGDVPRQPQFVGPTRSAFGILISERSLNRMGVPKFDSMPPSRAQSPAEPAPDSQKSHLDFWDCCRASDVTKYLVIYQEEVESVYPFVDIGEYIAKSKEIVEVIQGARSLTEDDGLCSKDIALARVAMATGIILDEPGKIELSTAIVDSVETNMSSMLSPQVDLKEIQLLAMFSIYYFHSGEELLAWRIIGIAARQALEMGLHRKRSLFDNVKDPDSRRLATRVFWCVYVLDRRWSFGTSLSFALVDKDIDPDLPKPNEEYLYLQCMVGYGKLCSQIWDAIPPFGSASQTIPEDTAAALDLKTQDWLDSIPAHLKLRHPRLGLAPRAQPRLPHRLRALLYLRGNYVRILIYRHHLMSTASILANPQNAWLVVDIAQDTIQVLVHLHDTTDIYSRQQNVFNHFLLSALAVLFLAVCHAPDMFSSPCRRTFSDGVELVRGLSRHSSVSKRLWNSIRGIIPRMKTFVFTGSQEENQEQGTEEGNGQGDPTTMEAQMPTSIGANEVFALDNIMVTPQGDLSSSVPDMFQMRNDLLDLFNAFGEGQQFLPLVPETFSDEEDFALATEQGKDITMQFQGLI
ncbi:activator of stress s 1 [Fusarium longipes]|uniref:Activator of stress s 1 n=1 Tax=Fusarium longipes TaxID=694270 RepID=A0A395T149_9HYPO|nr:activator of stress s 1 [Fusarium longipes]